MSATPLLAGGWNYTPVYHPSPDLADKNTVAYWMTTPARTIPRSTSLGDAYDMMLRWDVRHLLVTDSGSLVGIVTLGDLRGARPPTATGLSIHELSYHINRMVVADVMTHQPFTVTTITPIRVAAQLMLTNKIGGLPVLDMSDTVIGIITESDLFRVLAQN